MAIMVGDERFEDAYDAAAMVLECGEFRDVSWEPWRMPESGYIGPVYDMEVLNDYRLGDHAVQVRWMFTSDEIGDEDPEDWPYDNGTMEIVVDGDFVQEVE